MTCGIYMIQNKVNNKIYIGQAVDIKRRWKQHKCALRGDYHENKHLQNAWNSYKEVNFEFTIICECDENQLNTMEEYYIFELMSYADEVGYNKTYGGGQGGRPTEETRRKQSESKKIAMNRPEVRKKLSENNGSRRPEVRKKLSEANKGKTHSEETRKKLSDSLKGRILSEEHRKKISESHKGEKNPMYGQHLSEEHRQKISEGNKGKIIPEEQRKKISESKKGENHPMYGKHLPEETKKKLSEALKGENHPMWGKHHSEETRKKISESQSKGFKNPNSIPIVQLTLEGKLVNVYGSAGEAGRVGFIRSHIYSCCKGKRNTHKGYKWMYLSDYEAMKKEG